MLKQTLWAEIYRPKTVEECILPKRIHNVMMSFVEQKDVPNLLFYGQAGTVKTTTAKAIAHDLGSDVMYINMSDETGKADIMEKIIPFATTVSIEGKSVPKIIIGDECDRLSTFAQDSLKAYIEKFSSNCRFIFIANTPSRVIEPIKSRCNTFNFNIEKSDKQEILMKFFTRVSNILEENDISFDKKILARHIAKLFPDYRKIINSLQLYSNTYKTIDEGILTFTTDDIAKVLYDFIKNKNFNDARKWLKESLYSSDDIINALYNGLTDNVKQSLQPEFILIISEYAYKSAFVANQELNTMAMITELMGSSN